MTIGFRLSWVCAVAVAFVGTAFAQQVTQFDLPAQALAAALRAVGSQTSTNVLFDPPLVEGRDAPAVKGELTADQAFGRLLTGTGLKHRFLDEKTVMVVSTAPVQTSSRGAVEGGGQGNKGALTLASDDSSQNTTAGTTSSEASAGSEFCKQNPNDPSCRKDRIQEIVVTAQKREERLQDVPISITALSGESLDRSTLPGVAEILRTVPGVTMVPTNGNGDNVQLAVRGVTAFSVGGSGGTAVGYYIDSVPFGFVRSALVPNVDAFDLERVEVLRGPQGTLYGASSLNGVVRVLTKDANLDAFEFKGLASTSYTEDGQPNYRGDMAVNVPILEGKLAARLTAGHQDWGGWLDKLSSSEKDANDSRLSKVRLKVNAQPTEDLSIGLLASRSRSDYDQHGLAGEDDVNVSSVDEPISSDLDNFALKINYDFASFSVTSTTSYLEYVSDAILDLDLPGLDIPLSSRGISKPRAFVEEINFSSTGDGAWRWTAGGMYRDSTERIINMLIPFGGNPFAPDISVDASESIAVFGELTRLFMDGRIGLTGGLRYFEDEVTGTEVARSGSGVPVGLYSREKFDSLSPRAVLTWHPSRQKTFYASYAEGFRSGLSQPPNVLAIAPNFVPTKPDKLRNYELGMKGSLWDNRINIETAVYYMDWQDVQQRVTLLVIPGSGGAGIGRTAGINGESASGMGVDLQVTTRPVDPLEMGFSVSWNNLESDGDVISNNVVLIAQGERENLSAEKTIGAFVNYDFPLGSSGFNARLSASGTYVSQYPGFRTLQGTNVFATTGGSLLISQASFSIDAPSRWSGTLFVDNLNNEQTSPIESVIAGWQQRMRPRTIGLQVGYEFL